MYVLFVSRLNKVFHVRKATSPAAYEEPDYSDVSLVNDSIEGLLDTYGEAARIAKEEGWREYHISIDNAA